jgi:thiosulfate/3-mercaptopyruvate sulfurtransferase
VFLGENGIGNGTQVLAYDDRGGMIAGRLWWLLRWLGHKKAAVLDGGLTAWQAEGRTVTSKIPVPIPQAFIPNLQPQLVVSAAQVLAYFGDPGRILVDSRAPERYRGEIEPIDPIAGRIPGAVNHFWRQNLDTKGFFEIKDVLRGRFSHMFEDIPAERVTFYCGSGVTAAHNALAVAHSGLGMPKIYPGGWSEWIVDPDRPIARDG